MTKNPLINALLAILYVIFVSSVLYYGTIVKIGSNSIVAPIAMISLFTFSAATMGYLFLYQPFILYFDNKKIKPIGVCLTHGHYDHIMGALDLKLIYNIPLYCSEKDLFLLKRGGQTAEYFRRIKQKTPNIVKIDIDLDKEKEISLGKEKLEIIKTPGHTPGGICLYSKNSSLLFSGDTLFKDLRGRTDFKYSSTKEIFESLKNLMKLPKNTLVLSGHGESTTIEKESVRFL